MYVLIMGFPMILVPILGQSNLAGRLFKAVPCSICMYTLKYVCCIEYNKYPSQNVSSMVVNCNLGNPLAEQYTN